VNTQPMRCVVAVQRERASNFDSIVVVGTEVQNTRLWEIETRFCALKKRIIYESYSVARNGFLLTPVFTGIRRAPTRCDVLGAVWALVRLELVLACSRASSHRDNSQSAVIVAPKMVCSRRNSAAATTGLCEHWRSTTRGT
jgi:hypothetical protein